MASLKSLNRRLSIEPLERKDLMSIAPQEPLDAIDALQGDVAAEIASLSGTDLDPFAVDAALTEEADPLAGLSPSEIRRKSFEIKQERLWAQVAEIEAQIGETDTDIAGVEASLAAARRRLTEVDQLLREAELDAELEAGGAPTFKVYAPWGARRIEVWYWNMPADAVRITVDRAGSAILGPDHEYVLFYVPGGIGTSTMKVFRNDTGEELWRRDFQVFRGAVRAGFDETHYPLESLASGPRHTEEEVAAATAERATLTTQITTDEAELSELRAERDTLVATKNEAKREATPYPRMTVEASFEQDRNGQWDIPLNIHFRSPQTKTKIVISTSVGGLYTQREFTHLGGTQQSDWRSNFAPPYGGYGTWSGTFDVTMYGESGEVLDSVAIPVDGPNHKLTAPLEPALSELETGRIVDNPVPFELKVVQVSGSNILVHYTAPTDEATVAIPGGGLFASHTNLHEGGTRTATGIITMNGDMPSGTYPLILSDHGTERDRVYVNWVQRYRGFTDPAAGDMWAPQVAAASSVEIDPSLPLSSQVTTFLAQEAETESAIDEAQVLMAKQARLTSIQPADTFQTLARQIRSDIYEHTGFYVTPEMVTEAIYQVYPWFRPENLDAYIQQQIAASPPGTVSGNLRDGIVRYRLETMNQFFQDFAWFSEFMAEISAKGFESIIAMKQGASQTLTVQNLENFINSKRPFNSIARLDGIRISYPDVETVISEAKKVYDTQIDVMLGIPAEVARLQERDAFLSSDTYYQEVVLGQGDPESVKDVTILSKRKSLADGYSQEELDSSEQRRLGRAVRLIKYYVDMGTDSRIKLLVASREDSGVQRVRQLDDGTSEVTVYQDEIVSWIDETVEDNSLAGEAGEKLSGDLLALNNTIALSGANIEGSIISSRDININLTDLTTNGINVTLAQSGAANVKFTLTEPSMVNFWVDTGELVHLEGYPSPIQPDVGLALSGDKMQNPHVSNKAVPSAGESISAVLPAGVYQLTIKDMSDYAQATDPAIRSSLHLPNVFMGVQIEKYTTQKINGRISIPESGKTMPVSMSVAKYTDLEDGSWIRKNSDETIPLNPNIPILVVVPGMNMSETTTTIDNLTHELVKNTQNNNMQVVTLDWTEAAKDPTHLGYDAPWTRSVGKWGAQQLIAAGFAPSKINGVGYSHGTYVLYVMANAIQELQVEPINSLVALDPAGNIPAISGFGRDEINFSQVARNSIAIESSFGADSDWLASTAHTAFRINSPETHWLGTEHQLGLTTFTDILRHEREAPGDFSSHISLQRIMNPFQQQAVDYVFDSYEGNADIYEGGEFEAEIDIGVSDVTAWDGTYHQGHPIGLRYRKVGQPGEQFISYNTFA